MRVDCGGRVHAHIRYAFDSDECTMESSGSRWTIWKLGQSVGRHNATEFREYLLTQIFLFKCIIHSYVFVTVWAFLSKTPFAFGCWRIVYGTLSAHRNCITFYVLIAYLLEWNFGEITNISVPWGLYLLWEYNRKRTAWIAAALCIILCTKLWCLYGFPQTMHIRIIASLHHNLNKQTIQKKNDLVNVQIGIFRQMYVRCTNLRPRRSNDYG